MVDAIRSSAQESGPILPCVTGEIELNFIEHRALHVQAMALDCRTISALRAGGKRRYTAPYARLPRRDARAD